MTQMTIKVENWKHVSSREVLRVMRNALSSMLKNLRDADFDGAKPLDSAHYNDYSQSGVELHITWK